MFAVCIESSHARGMGHFFRALNFIDFLEIQQEKYIIFINDDPVAVSILREKNIPYETVDLLDLTSDWEEKLIDKYNITLWINDRLDTDILHSRKIINHHIPLVTFDDNGTGAEPADINFLGLEFDKNKNFKGKKVFTGINYLILNKEINKFKRLRSSPVKNILVTLGGSDTYGSTIKAVKTLKELGKKATVLIGPSFTHENELNPFISENFIIKKTVPSLIEEFCLYDLAVTGGGITSFEANASGLPCIIIANEIHEIKNALFLEKSGTSVFAGFHENINKNVFENIPELTKMSKNGIEIIKTDAVENIYNEIKKCQKK